MVAMVIWTVTSYSDLEREISKVVGIGRILPSLYFLIIWSYTILVVKVKFFVHLKFKINFGGYPSYSGNKKN